MKTKSKLILLATVGTILIILSFLWGFKKIKSKIEKHIKNIPTEQTAPTIVPTILPNITATPSAKVLTFEEMNKLYGPCEKISVLMYHHIANLKEITSQAEKSLTVDTENFRKQMQYLKDKSYSVIEINDLKNFLENGTKLPAKSVLITADDAYDDNYLNMFPILKEFGFKATIFTPTGLVDNQRYLNWQKIEEMKNSGLVYFGNHTWSHHNSAGTIELQKKEIGTADTQLSEKNLNVCKAFAYPYGKPSLNAEKILEELGYKIAFTTTHGNLVCKKQSLEIPRIRVGNAQLSNYGL